MKVGRVSLFSNLTWALPWLHSVVAQGKFQSVLEAFPELSGLENVPVDPIEGGQSFTYCCLLAINQSYAVIDGDVRPTGRYINESVADLRNSQWPCGAEYNGNKTGAPLVQAPYRWVEQNCPGWEQNSGDGTGWTQLFVGFLLPAIAFCLIVPRQQELKLPRALFEVELGRVSGLMSAPFLALAAGIIVAIDTIYWLITVFTFPGPILLSGLYEATIDKRMLTFMRDKISNGRLTRTDRSRILFAILVGNLDLGWGAAEGYEGQAWLDTQNLVVDLEEAEKGLVTSGSNIDFDRIEVCVKAVKVRLQTMLACQFPFGTTVGAPIVFFLGSFGYALRELSENLGRNTSSHALAYGSFWVVMPLVSIVASCLLAGNNPNTLEGIVGKRAIATPYPTFFGFVPSFDTGYKPAWMWNRGRNKQHWAEAIARRYEVDDLREKCVIRNRDWLKLSSVVTIMMFIPCAFAFVVSYLTPKVGLGCRSIDFMMFFLLQTLLVACWVWKYLEDNFNGADMPTSLGRSTLKSPTPAEVAETESARSKIDVDGEKSASPEPDIESTLAGQSLAEAETSRKYRRKVRRRQQAWWVIVIFLAVCSCFFGIGGTLMQLIGVYQNALCSIPLNDWIKRESTMWLSSNSSDAIRLAQSTWLPIGVAGMFYLAFICYMGWWYNTYLRLQFDDLVDDMDKEMVETSTFINIKSRASTPA